jgi:hypothetical protein
LRITVILLFLLLIFESCHVQKTNVAVLHPEKEIEIGRTVKNQSVSLIKPKLYFTPYDTMISFIDASSAMLRFWSLKNNTYADSVDIRFYNYQFIQDYFIMSEDTMMFAFNTTYFLLKHDKCVIITNRNKDIIEKMSFVGAPVLLDSGQSEHIYKGNHYYSDYTYFPLLYHHGAAIASLAPFSYHYCDSALLSNITYPLGFIFRPEMNRNYEPIEISFPCKGMNSYFPINFKYPRGVLVGNNIVFGFGNEPVLYSFNLDNRQIKTSEIELMTTKPFVAQSEKYSSFYDYSQSEYLDLVYNEFTGQIYWFARMKTDTVAPPLVQNYPRYSFAVIDTSLMKISEGLLPEGFGPPVIPYRNGFLAINKMKSNESKRIFLTYFIIENKQIRKKKGSVFPILTPVYEDVQTSELIKNYLVTMTGNADGIFLLVPLENSCKSSVDLMISMLSQLNTEDKLKREVHTIVISNNEGKTETFLTKTGFSSSEDHNISVDSSDLIKRFILTWTNPRIIQVNEEGSIILDRRYNPSDMEKLKTLITR